MTNHLAIFVAETSNYYYTKDKSLSTNLATNYLVAECSNQLQHQKKICKFLLIGHYIQMVAW